MQVVPCHSRSAFIHSFAIAMEAENAEDRHICPFCFKSFKTSNSSENARTFFTLLERHIGVAPDAFKLLTKIDLNCEESKLRVEGSKICVDCFSPVKSFCDLYHQLKCIELQLQWKLQTILRVMRQARRVPSRMQLVKQAFGRDEEGMERCNSLMEAKLRFIQICARHILNTFPRVALKKAGSNIVLKTDEKLLPQSSLPSAPNFTTAVIGEGNENNVSDFLRQWVLSFAAVVALLSSVPDSFQNPDATTKVDNPSRNISNESVAEIVVDDDCFDTVAIDTNKDGECASAEFQPLSSSVPQTQDIRHVKVESCAHSEEHIGNQELEIIITDDAHGKDGANSIMNSPNTRVIQYTKLGSEIAIRVELAEEEPRLAEKGTPIEPEPTIQDEENMEELSLDGSENSDNDHHDHEPKAKFLDFQEDTTEVEMKDMKVGENTLRLMDIPDTISDSKPLEEASSDEDEDNFEMKPVVQKERFACRFCPKTYSHKTGLDGHMTAKHPEKKARKAKLTASTPFDCKMCQRAFKTYASFLVHTKSFEHQRKSRRRRENTTKRSNIQVNKPKNTVTEVNTTALEEASVSMALQVRSEDVSPQTTLSKSRYNLRNRRLPSKTKRKIPNTSSEKSTSDDDFSLDDDDTSTSSSSSLDSEVDDESSAKKSPRFYPKRSYCKVDGCRYSSYVPVMFEEHTKLHEPGKYPCNFCDSVEDTPIKIVMHEIASHSKTPPSTSKNVYKYKCPRCPYQVKQESHCFFHFARAHLNFPGPPKPVPEKCPICSIEVTNFKNHLKKWHRFKGTGPSKLINCQEPGCTAYFTTEWLRQRHKREVHKLGVKYWSSDEDDDVEASVESLQCKLCSKKFRNEFQLRAHKRFFHEKKGHSLPTERTGLFANKVFLCPELKCAKSFKHEKVLKAHQKLHGNFKCQVCDIVTDWAPDLAVHEAEHSMASDANDIVKFKCYRCNYTTFKKKYFVTHFLEAHLNITDKLYECDICHDRFGDRDSKRKHFKSYHKLDNEDSEKHNCDKCSAYFRQPQQLEIHQQKCTENDLSNPKAKAPQKRHVCPVSKCTETFKFLEELEEHKKLHGNFSCQFCDVKTDYANDLAVHELQHYKKPAKNNEFNCPRCPSYRTPQKKIYFKHFLGEHLRLNAKVFICHICNAQFSLEMSKWKHNKHCHDLTGVDPQTLQRCEKCPAYFLKRIQLLLHRKRIHNGLDNISLECVHCSKSYSNRQSLRSHLYKKHGMGKSGEHFDFLCDFPKCLKRFENNDALLWHKTYSCIAKERKTRKQAAKPDLSIVVCQQCGKEIKGEGALKRHTTTIHRKGRPEEFKCDECDKTFKYKATLEMHQEFHKGPDQWKFMCQICSKKCPSKTSVEQHMNTHTKAKPFVCQICGEKYAHRHNLRNHVNTKHKDEGVQDVARKVNRRFFVSRKGKKLSGSFCFTMDNDRKNDEGLEEDCESEK